MKRSYQFITMTTLLIGICYITYLFHIQLGRQTVFTHFFYIPIIMAILWWGRKGFWVVWILSALLLASQMPCREISYLIEDLMRSFMFVFVGMVTFFLNSRKENYQNQILINESKFRYLFESLADGVLICEAENDGKDFILKEINTAGKNISRLTDSAYRNKRVDEIFPGLSKSGIVDTFKRVWATGKAVHITDDYYCDDRVAGWRMRNVFKLPTGEVVCLYRDLTEKKRNEKERLLLAKAIEQIYETVMIVNEDRTIAYVNRAFEKTTGYRSIEVLGHPPRFLQSDVHDEGFNENLWNVLKACRPWSGRLTNKRKDQTRYDSWTTISPVKIEKEKLSFVFVQRDITEDIKKERAMQQSQKMEAIGTLAGGIAHDLNNILYPIMGHAELAIQSVPENQEVLAHLKGVLKASVRARELVKQILTFSRASDSPPEPVLPHLIIHEAIKFLRASIPGSIAIKTHIDEESGYILAEPTHMHQIVLNLCTNAYHAMKDSGGCIEVNLYPVQTPFSDAFPVVELPPGAYICLEVTDNGTGIDPDIIDHIFEPFFTTKKNGEGTGLGLSVVYGIVKKYKGVINVSNNPVKGVSFRVYLPKITVLTELPGKLSFRQPLHGNGHILLVDDDDMTIETERLLLESIGYSVTTRQNPLDAMEIFRCHPDNFDVVVTDYHMPQLSGLDLSRRIKELKPDIPIIVLTGFQDDKIIESAREKEIDQAVNKPVNRSEFACLIAKVLEGKRDLVPSAVCASR